jgi:hypothetical protein
MSGVVLEQLPMYKVVGRAGAAALVQGGSGPILRPSDSQPGKIVLTYLRGTSVVNNLFTPTPLDHHTFPIREESSGTVISSLGDIYQLTAPVGVNMDPVVEDNPRGGGRRTRRYKKKNTRRG